MWKGEKALKDCHGLDKSSGRWVFYPISQTTDHERCSVRYCKIFKSHCPAGMNETESSFYFTITHQQNPGYNNWYKKTPLEKNKSRIHFWMLLETFPFTELVFQSYSIQTYLWLCSSAKWLPERETSWDLYKSPSIQLQRRMSFTLSRLANLLTASEFPFVFSSYSSEKNQDQALLQKVNSWLLHISRSYLLLFQVINCQVIKVTPKS